MHLNYPALCWNFHCKPVLLNKYKTAVIGYHAAYITVEVKNVFDEMHIYHISDLWEKNTMRRRGVGRV